MLLLLLLLLDPTTVCTYDSTCGSRVVVCGRQNSDCGGIQLLFIMSQVVETENETRLPACAERPLLLYNNRERV